MQIKQDTGMNYVILWDEPAPYFGGRSGYYDLRFVLEDLKKYGGGIAFDRAGNMVAESLEGRQTA